jgi:hypothetical protein
MKGLLNAVKEAPFDCCIRQTQGVREGGKGGHKEYPLIEGRLAKVSRTDSWPSLAASSSSKGETRGICKKERMRLLQKDSSPNCGDCAACVCGVAPHHFITCIPIRSGSQAP